MKNAVIRARIDPELKANALRVLASSGLEASDGIRVDVSKGQMLLLRPKRLRGAKVRWPKASLV